MAEDKQQKTASFIERLKQQAATQQNYGGAVEKTDARMEVRDCPNCGAGRAYRHGLTTCAYCGFSFMHIELTDGIHIKKTHNS